VMDGYEFFEEVSKNEGYKDIPFLFLTAKTTQDEKIKGLASGAIDYIYKPFSIDEFLYKVSSIINNQNIKQALYEKDKFATLGMLVGGIAHEIRNPLSNITAPLDYIRTTLLEMDYFKENKLLKKYFGYINTGIMRIDSLIDNLRFLYYKGEIDKEELSLKKIIHSITEVYRGTLKKPIVLSYKVASEHYITGNKEILVQILSNLISNAIDAIEKDGEISVTAEKVKEFTDIRVRDTGCGISKNDLPYLFNAFFTRKEAGKGTGLGLYIVKELALKMGWEIDVLSEEGKGTEFVIKVRE
jgi:two-component system NtrC family sensor kinase